VTARRTIFAVCVCALLSPALLVADEMSVNFDPAVDFSQFKTFAVRMATIQSARPELDNPLFKKMLERAIESALAANGLTETGSSPGLFVDYRITNEDISSSRPGTPLLVGPGGRGRAGVSTGPQPVRFTEGTLVIDLSRPGDATPIWRGVYRDDESTGSKLVQKLPEDAKKLLARYPPKK
jgi:hypothetical protein